MDDIQYQAWNEFKHFARREDPEYILQVQKNLLSCQAKKENKLRNPVHYHTGKPLHEQTIQEYKADLKRTTKWLRALEIALEMLKKYGFMGNGKKSINEILSAYPERDVSPEDAPWIEALREIKKERGEFRAWRESMIHKIKTCQEDCPLKEFCKSIMRID